MNEYPPYITDTAHRPIDVFEPMTMSRPHVPCYAVVDDEGRRLYRLGDPKINDSSVEPYVWSEDNTAEVELGILKRADSVQELAAIIGCDTEALQETIDRWNYACESRKDKDYDRPAKTMMPIKTPPYFVGEIWPLVSNTQGGPVHDARQRVLNPFGEPIARLYEAGELGSIWGYLYLGGGNLSECVITGRLAAQEIALLEPWDRTEVAEVVAG